jgi:hypothetical protein
LVNETRCFALSVDAFDAARDLRATKTTAHVEPAGLTP